MMKKLLQPIQRPGLLNFIDDILVATETWEEHLEIIKSLLNRLRETGLTARPSKCLIGYEKLKFLGHMVERHHLMPDEDKVDKLKHAPRPTNKTGVRSFLGLCGYYQKFVPNYNSIASPLSDLTRKGRPEKIIWDDRCEQAFTQLKAALTSQPILRLPDLNRPFTLRTDASILGLGAVLMQDDPEQPDTLFPVAYASRKLSPAEQNYPTIELECLAIVWGIEKFQIFLYGTQFTLQTDHRPLTFLSLSKNLNRRLMRHSLTLSQYAFKIQYISGSRNVGSDFLSRHPTGMQHDNPVVNVQE